MSFFNKLGKTITDTTHTVVEKTKSSTDTIRLNGLISDEERNINAAYLSIGKKYEELHGGNYEPEFAEFFSKIQESRQKIEGYRDQIRKNKHLMLCGNCGNEIAETALFCTKCGAENPVGKRLAEERAAREAAEREAAEQAAAQRAAAQAAKQSQPQPTVGTSLCPNCGSPRTPGALFCTSCGTRFAPEAAPTPTPTPVPQPVPTPAEPVAKPIPVPTESTPTPVTAEPTETETKAAPVAQEPVSTPTESTPVSAPAEKVCPNCGRVIPEGNRFCTGCGTKVDGEMSKAQEKTCPVCGKPVPAENHFCTNCGTKMDETV